MEAYQATTEAAMNPQEHTMTVLAQIASWIPDKIVENLARKRIVVFDKIYVDFRHLWRLNEGGVSWVTQAKDNMLCEVVGQQVGGKWTAAGGLRSHRPRLFPPPPLQKRMWDSMIFRVSEVMGRRC